MQDSFAIMQMSQVVILVAVALVFIRWIWLKTRLSNIQAFMSQIVKLTKAGNLDRAIKLAGVLPSDPVAMGCLAVLRAHNAGIDMNETEVIDTFNAALPGGSVRFALGRFRALKTLAFFLALGAVIARLTVLPVFAPDLFWIATGVFVVLFVSAGLGAARMERDTFEAAGQLMGLVAVPDEDDPGVEAEETPDRGEGHLAVRLAFEDADARTDEITTEGVADLLLAGFRKEHGLDLRLDPNAKTRIMDAAEKAVIELRSMQETGVDLPFLTATEAGPLHLVTTVTRKKALVFSHRAREKETRTPPIRESTGASRIGQTSSLSDPAPSLPPSPVPEHPAPPTESAPIPSSERAVVCRNCATRIPVEPEILAQIEGEFDLWTKVKTRCPKCGGSFFELRT